MAGVARGVVLTDAAYGSDGEFPRRRHGDGLDLCGGGAVDDQRLAPRHGASATQALERTRTQALACAARGRSSAGLGQDVGDDAATAGLARRVLARGLQPDPTSRFAAVRIRPASRAGKLAAPHPLEWLLIEWPEGEREPTKYWLSTLPEDTPIEVLVDTAKLRWRIECDYEELKSELGLAHFEGRGWRGFHHHATLCIAAYGFLIRERAPFPFRTPAARRPWPFRSFTTPRHPRSGPSATSRSRTRSPPCESD